MKVASEEQAVRGRDAEQEHDVEQRAEHDERLPTAPPRHGVVAQRADRGLDDDADDRAGETDDRERLADIVLRDEVAEVQSIGGELADRGVDRREAQPVGRQASELAQRQQRRRAAGLGRRRDRDVRHRAPSAAHPTRILVSGILG